MGAPLKIDKNVRSLKRKKKEERRKKLNNYGIKEENKERNKPTKRKKQIQRKKLTQRKKNEFDYLNLGNVVGDIYTRNLRKRNVPIRFYNEDADEDLYREIGYEGNYTKAEHGIESNPMVSQTIKVEIENDQKRDNFSEVSDDQPLLEPPAITGDQPLVKPVITGDQPLHNPPVICDDQPIFIHPVIIPNGDYQPEKLPDSFANVSGQQVYEINALPVAAESSYFQDYQRTEPNVSGYDIIPTTTYDESRTIYSPITYLNPNVKINSPEENIQQDYSITPSTSYAEPRTSSLPFTTRNPNTNVNLTEENVQGLPNSIYYQGNNIEEQPQDLRVHLNLDSSEPRNRVVEEETTQTIVSNQPPHQFISEMNNSTSYELSVSTVDTTTRRFGPAYKDLPDTEHRRYYVYAYSEFGHPERERKYVEHYKFDKKFEDILSDFTFSNSKPSNSKEFR